MATLILIACALALVHFAYEAILLPSIRLHLRFRNFCFRDRLRALAHKEGDRLDQNVYRCLQDSINASLTTLYRVDISMLLDIRRIVREDPALLRRAEKRLKELDACPIEEIHKIRREHEKILGLALVANSAGFLIMLLPFLLFGLIAAFVLRKLNSTIQKVRDGLRDLICMPDEELERRLSNQGGFSAV